MRLDLNLTNVKEHYLSVRPRNDYSLEIADIFTSEPMSNRSDVTVKIEQTNIEVLPAPYNTKCYDYSLDPVVKSMGECRRRCVIAQTLRKRNLIEHGWHYFNTSSKEYTDRYTFITPYCSKRCRQPCQFKKLTAKFIYNGDQSSSTQNIRIYLPQIVFHVKMTPKMTFGDLVFNIFGNFAFTIGSSLYTFVIPIDLFLLHIHVQRKVHPIT